jgi:hypothetical protein
MGSTKTPSCSSHRCDLWTGEVWQSNQGTELKCGARGGSLRSCAPAVSRLMRTAKHFHTPNRTLHGIWHQVRHLRLQALGSAHRAHMRKPAGACYGSQGNKARKDPVCVFANPHAPANAWMFLGQGLYIQT